MKERSEHAVREALADFLGILRYKVMNDVITFDDVKTMLVAIESTGGISATISDLAGYYKTSEDNVRHIMHRNFLPAPSRKVYYDFGSFREKVPRKWHDRASLPAD